MAYTPPTITNELPAAAFGALTTKRIREYRQKYHPVKDPEPRQADEGEGDQFNEFGENIEMHDSALFDFNVEVPFYDGRRISIPQQSTPEGWEPPF